MVALLAAVVFLQVQFIRNHLQHVVFARLQDGSLTDASRVLVAHDLPVRRELVLVCIFRDQLAVALLIFWQIVLGLIYPELLLFQLLL